MPSLPITSMQVPMRDFAAALARWLRGAVDCESAFDGLSSPISDDSLYALTMIEHNTTMACPRQHTLPPRRAKRFRLLLNYAIALYFSGSESAARQTRALTAPAIIFATRRRSHAYRTRVCPMAAAWHAPLFVFTPLLPPPADVDLRRPPVLPISFIALIVSMVNAAE